MIETLTQICCTIAPNIHLYKLATSICTIDQVSGIVQNVDWARQVDVCQDTCANTQARHFRQYPAWACLLERRCIQVHWEHIGAHQPGPISKLPPNAPFKGVARRLLDDLQHTCVPCSHVSCVYPNFLLPTRTSPLLDPWLWPTLVKDSASPDQPCMTLACFLTILLSPSSWLLCMTLALAPDHAVVSYLAPPLCMTSVWILINHVWPWLWLQTTLLSPSSWSRCMTLALVPDHTGVNYLTPPQFWSWSRPHHSSSSLLLWSCTTFIHDHYGCHNTAYYWTWPALPKVYLVSGPS